MPIAKEKRDYLEEKVKEFFSSSIKDNSKERTKLEEALAKFFSSK